MAYETIIYERRGAVALLTLNRPERLNALNGTLLEEMGRALDAAEGDPEVRALVLTGAGRAFSSGFDLKDEHVDMPEGVEGWRPALQAGFGTIMRFWNLRKPTIAAVHGFALAGGCELALACDITLAAEGTLFGEPELRFGAGIVVMLLPWMTGPKKAKELLFTGNDKITAEEAHAMGLVNQVVPEERRLEAALEMARKIAVIDPGVLAMTKEAVNRTYDRMGMAESLKMALDMDVQIESMPGPTRLKFAEIVRRDGLKAAIAWRDARFEEEGG